MRAVRPLLLAAFLALPLLAAAPAGAATTIGQLAPGNPPTSGCGVSDYDIFDPTVTSGNGYVVPAGGDQITSWSTNGGAGAGRTLAMKIFRLVSGTTYQVVAHDGPRPINPGLNTFPVSIPVKAGDVVGINSGNSGSGLSSCFFSVTPETALFFNPGVADGSSATYGPDPNLRANVTAVVASKPLNSFSFGKVKDNRKKGTARLAVSVPGPGTLTLTGKGIKPDLRAGGATASIAVAAAGTVQLPVNPKHKLRKKLRKRGKVKVKVSVTYTPRGEIAGDPNTLSRHVKLLKKTS
jgi:hypothetical protein